MSTEFRTKSTDELAFVRYSGGRQVKYEFGTVTNFLNCYNACRDGEIYKNIYDAETIDKPQWFEILMVTGRITIGEFPITMEVGSGEVWRFTVEELDVLEKQLKGIGE